VIVRHCFSPFRAHLVPMLAAILAAVAAGCSDRAGPEADRPPGAQLPYAVGEDTILYDPSVGDTVPLRPVDLDVDGASLVIADGMLPGLYVFPLDRDGEPGEPRSIGREGAGPFEFRSPRAVALGPDRVALLDPRNLRVSVFDRSGDPITEFAVPPASDLAFDAAGRLHVAVLAPVEGRPGATVQVVDPASGAIVGAYGRYEEREAGSTNAMHNTTRLSPTADGGMWYAYPYRGEVGRVDAEFRDVLQPTIEVDPSVPDAESYVEFLDEERMRWAITREPILSDIAATDRGELVVLASLESNRPGVRPRQVLQWYGADGLMVGEAPAAGSPLLRALASDGGETLYWLGASPDDFTSIQVRRARVTGAGDRGR
jgi:hypothetical protein